MVKVDRLMHLKILAVDTHINNISFCVQLSMVGNLARREGGVLIKCGQLETNHGDM